MASSSDQRLDPDDAKEVLKAMMGTNVGAGLSIGVPVLTALGASDRFRAFFVQGVTDTTSALLSPVGAVADEIIPDLEFPDLSELLRFDINVAPSIGAPSLEGPDIQGPDLSNLFAGLDRDEPPSEPPGGQPGAEGPGPSLPSEAAREPTEELVEGFAESTGVPSDRANVGADQPLGAPPIPTQFTAQGAALSEEQGVQLLESIPGTQAAEEEAALELEARQQREDPTTLPPELGRIAEAEMT